MIYGLVDPRTEEVRYIGKTVHGMTRIYEHLRPSAMRTENTHKSKWLTQLSCLGLVPEVTPAATAAIKA